MKKSTIRFCCGILFWMEIVSGIFGLMAHRVGYSFELAAIIMFVMLLTKEER